MPSKASKHFFHKNRSQASLLTSQDPNGPRPQYLADPIDSPLHSPAVPPPNAAALQDEIEGQQYGHPDPADHPRPYQTGFPSRSQSQRTPPAQALPFNQNQPTIQLQQPNSAQSAIDDDPDAYYHQAPAARPQKEEPKKRRFFGLGSSSRDSHTTAPAPPAAPQRLGRSVSVRTKNYPYQNPPLSTTRPVQQRWPSESSGSTYPPPASEEDDDTGAGLPSSASGPAPPIPDKDPLRSTDFAILNNGGAYRKPSLQGVTVDTNGRPRADREGSVTSTTWESPQSLHQYRRAQSDLHQFPPSYQPSPSSATSTSSHPLSARGQQEVLHHYHQEPQTSRPPSQQSYGPPSPTQTYPGRLDPHQSRSAQGTTPAPSQIPGSMGPPQNQPSRDRRSQELAQQQQNHQGGGNREGAGYQPYHQIGQAQGQPQGPPPAYSSQLGVSNQQ
ncbi:MAG: hypothetical protein Q9226_007766, partial [Calogaya cf. arnoldii]